jgi:hypothetical protein
MNVSIPRQDEEPKSLAADRFKYPSSAGRQPSLNGDLYDASPPLSPLSREDLKLEEHEEAYRIIWGEDASIPDTVPEIIGQQLKKPVERNDKCLVGDVARTGDKARLMEEEGKYLREEQERELGKGGFGK